MQPMPCDAPSKQFLLRKLRCRYCGAEGAELTVLVMVRVVDGLICVPCNRLIRTGGSPLLRAQFPVETAALICRGLLSGASRMVGLNNV